MARYWLGQHPAQERNTGSALANVPYRVENVDGTATLVVYDDDTGSTVISSVGVTNRFGEPEGWIEPASGRIRYHPDQSNEKVEYFVAPGAGGGGGAATYSEVTTKGDLLAGTGVGAVARVGIPSGGTNRASVVTDATQSGGVRYSVKAAPYNPFEAAAGVGTGNAATDTTALNATLAAAAGNGRVFLPPATYRASGYIFVPSRSFVDGAGIGQSVIKAADTLGNQSMFVNAGGQSSGNSDIYVQNVEFDGNKTVRGTLPVFNTGNPTADANGRPEGMAAMVEFHGSHSTPGLGKHIHFVGCAVHDSLGFGMGFQFIEDSSVIGCYSYDNYRDGISAGNRIRHYSIMGCHIHDNGDDQIAVSSGTSAQLGYNNTIVGNTVGPHSLEHPGHGIAMYGLQNSVVSSNALEGGHNRGIILFASSTAAPNNILISNNVLKIPGGSNEFEGSGIQIGTSSNVSPITDVTVSNNIVRSPLTDGIRVMGTAGGPCRWINIKDNELVGGAGFGAGHGIHIAAHATDIKMAENEIREFDGRGIYHGTTGIARTKIVGGTIENCCQVGGGAGIALGATADVTLSGGLRVLDNQAPQTQTGAVEWGSSSQVFIDGANFYGCSAGATFTGTQPATANLGTYVDRAGVLQGGGGSVDLTSVANVEELQDSVTHKPATAFGGTTRVWAMVAKFPLRIMAASLVSTTTVTANNTNYWTVLIRKWHATGGVPSASTIATKTTQVAPTGETITSAVDWNYNSVTFANGSGQAGQLVAGDVVEFLFTPTAAPTALSDLLLTVRYEPL